MTCTWTSEELREIVEEGDDPEAELAERILEIRER